MSIKEGSKKHCIFKSSVNSKLFSFNLIFIMGICAQGHLFFFFFFFPADCLAFSTGKGIYSNHLSVNTDWMSESISIHLNIYSKPIYNKISKN